MYKSAARGPAAGAGAARGADRRGRRRAGRARSRKTTSSTRSSSTSTTRRSKTGPGVRQSGARTGSLIADPGPELLWQRNRTTTKRSGWSASADADEIRKAYRKLARKHHPDLESRRQGRRGSLQESPGSLRHSERSEEEADVRSVRLLFGERNARRRRRTRRSRARPEHGLRRIRFFRRFHARRGRRPRAAVRPGGIGQFSGHLQPVVRAASTSRSTGRAAKRAPISNTA